MVESLFFGDPAAIDHAAGRFLPPFRFDPALHDIEAFVTADPTYLKPEDGWIPPGARREAPWAKANRHRHPKHYLQYLLDPSGIVFRAYKEKDQGKAALEALSWERVVEPAPHARLVRALLDDIAHMVGSRPPWLKPGPLHPLTCLKPGGTLRNIL